MQPRKRFGAQTPPAIFSLLLGLFGLTLAWRAAALALPLPAAVSELLLGGVTGLFLVALLAYIAKFMRRPASLLEDLRVLPGRGGLAALAVSVSALSTGLIAVSTAAATGLMWFALAFHVLMTGLVIYTLLSGPREQRQVTPIWHLSFVGVIVTAVSAVRLEHYALAALILWVTLALALIIYAVSAYQLATRIAPAPLRPLLAIHLAPASLFTTVALGFPAADYPLMPLLAQVSLGAAVLIGLALLFNIRTITAAGFSPMWASFTFPISAFTSAVLTFAHVAGAQIALMLGAVMLAAASGVVGYIAFKVLRMWLNGQLAVKTNAAKA